MNFGPGNRRFEMFSGRASRRVIGSLLLLVAAFGGCAKETAENPGPPQASPDQLERVEGRLHFEGEDEPFTGVMVELYSDGVRKARSELEDGRLHGLSEGWFADGQLQIREHFVHGISHGRRTRYYPDGKKRSETEIRDGEIDGTFRRWRADGSLAEETEFDEGMPDGSSRAYFSSGYVRTLVTLSAGEVVERKSWDDGEMQQPRQ